MRKNLPLVVSAMVLGGLLAVGCKASIKVGGAEEPAPTPTPTATAEPAPAAPAVKKPKIGRRSFKVSNDGKVELPGPVVFETGSDKLSPESDAVLEHVQKYLEEKPEVTLLRIEGHTDSDGDDAANQTLSEARSMAVAMWLVAKGIDCKRLLPVGFGESQPVAPNDTAEGKAQNRRTSFFNAAISGRPIAGKPVDGGGKRAGDPCVKK
jgi:OOP family OmpA-OmpF porin